jgi:hypothetical protein
MFGTGNVYWLDDLNGDSFTFFNKTRTLDSTYFIIFSTDGYVQIYIDTNEMITCDGLFRSMDSIDNSSRLSYKIEGNAGNKILKFQWKNLKIRSGQPGNFVNFQIWIYQATSIIEYHYGPSSASNAAGYTQATGPSVGITYNDFGFTQVYEKIWLHNLPSNLSIDSAKVLSYPNIKGVPPEGTVYRFIPRSIVASVEATGGPDNFSISPNPSRGDFKLLLSRPLVVEAIISLTDVQGKVVHTQLAPAGSNDITISPVLPTGTYMIRILSGDKKYCSVIVIGHE